MSQQGRRPFVQQIPRPVSARLGAPAPWLAMAAHGERPSVTVAEVRRAVAGVGDLTAPHPGDGPASSVLVVVWQEDLEARILLTRRAAWLRSHGAQVAFPGGRVEPGETAVEAALREAQEEVGLDPSSVEIVGRLSRLHTISAGAGIQPFVGVVAGRPTTVANPDEVDRVFDVALGELMAEDVFHEEIWRVAGVDRSIYFFDVAGETVWGATARILHELLVLVTRPHPRPSPGAGSRLGGGR